jgi:hypothetical protein
VGLGFFLWRCFPVATGEQLNEEVFALTYGGHFNSLHCEQMPTAIRRWHLRRLYEQKVAEDEKLKEARSKAKKGRKRR